MKTVWIVVGVLAGLGLLCCGGIFLVGRNVFNNYVAINLEAEKYSKDVFEKTVKDWNTSALIAESSAEFRQYTTEDSLKKQFSAIKAKLGNFVKVDPFSATSTKANNNNGVTKLEIVTSSMATFEKGAASAQLTVVKENNKWQVKNFSIN